MITFEYPLNEKIRSYLRFEFLFVQIQQSILFAHKSDSFAFFKAFFELLELSERCDIRHDLTKDLRQLSAQMSCWLGRENVNDNAVQELLCEIELLTNAVLAMPKQLSHFKTNRFLNSVKQRFSIPGGSCNFDLPQLHFWLSSDLEKRQLESQTWLSHFTDLEKALTLFLKMKRSQGIHTEQITQSGFYQGETENSSFIVIEVEKKLGLYPVISGHKNRFSVRFINADDHSNSVLNTPFHQIIC